MQAFPDDDGRPNDGHGDGPAEQDPSAGGAAAPLDQARRHRREWQVVIVVALVVVAALGAWRWWQDREHDTTRAAPGARITATAGAA